VGYVLQILVSRVFTSISCYSPLLDCMSCYATIQVIYCDSYDRADFTDMIDEIWDLKQRCGHVNNIMVDAASPVTIQALKKQFEERYDEQWIRDQFAYCRKHNLYIEDRMFVVPVPFSVEGAKMLQYTKALLDEREEDDSSLLQIDRERFTNW
jgi:hypothetical protein